MREVPISRDDEAISCLAYSEIAKQLVAWAGIVLENFAGGILKRMGLGYEELIKIKPDIIMLNSYALKRILGMSDEEVEELIREGIVE